MCGRKLLLHHDVVQHPAVVYVRVLVDCSTSLGSSYEIEEEDECQKPVLLFLLLKGGAP